MPKIKTSTFDLQITNGKARVARNLEFEGGDTVAFQVHLDDYQSLTLAEIHQKSARRVIELMEAWLKPA